MDQALEGLRIADLTIITAGANATQMLADLGAEVIKVESATYMDPFRSWQGPLPSGPDVPADPWNFSPTFNMVNRNKLGISLDLKQARGREVFLDLVRVSDAVTENFRQGVMERLGLSYDTLRALNPGIVMLSLGSQGSTGPESGYGSFGSTLDALSGLASLTGYEDTHPIWSSREVNYPDQVASLLGAGLLLAAIHQRDNTGEGCHIDLSQREFVTTLIGEYVLEYTAGGSLPERHGNQRPGFAPNDCYRCKGDDEWVAISVESDDEWRSLCEVLGRPDLATDERYRTRLARWDNQSSLRPDIERWTSARTKWDVMQALQRVGVAATAVLNGKDMLENPHLAARGYYVNIDNSRAEKQTLRVAPYHFSVTPPAIRRPAPTFGQDTDEVLRRVLGYSDATIEELRALGVTAREPVMYRSR